MAEVLRWPDMSPGDVRPMGLTRWKAHLELDADETITGESWASGPVPGSTAPLGVVSLGAHAYDPAKDRTSVAVTAVGLGDVRCTCRVETSKGQVAYRSADVYIVPR